MPHAEKLPVRMGQRCSNMINIYKYRPDKLKFTYIVIK